MFLIYCHNNANFMDHKNVLFSAWLYARIFSEAGYN